METLTTPTARSMAAIFELHRESARKKFLEFVATISREDFVRPLPEAQGRSIRDLLVRIVDVDGLLISLLQARPHQPLAPDRFPTIESILSVAEELADRIHNVLMSADEGWFAREGIFSPPGGPTRRAVPAWIAVHMLTQEYQHKGQIELLARGLGYEPPSADFYA